MTRKLLVIVDLGHLKAYRVEEDKQFSRPRTELLDQKSTDVTRHLVEVVTDRAGQFRKGSFPAGPADRSDGEAHNLALERRRRALKNLAQHICRLVALEKTQELYLAAGQEINQAVIAALDKEVRAKLKKNVQANLTKLGMDEVLAHFNEENTHMAKNKGKPSGKYAEAKTAPGRKGDYKRSGWPEDAPTQYVQNAAGRQVGRLNEAAQAELSARAGQGPHQNDVRLRAK